MGPQAAGCCCNLVFATMLLCSLTDSLSAAQHMAQPTALRDYELLQAVSGSTGTAAVSDTPAFSCFGAEVYSL
jgi:hypothetical protein